MLMYKGKKNNTYQLVEPAWKSGGEGSIYKIRGSSNKIAKIFAKEKLTVAQKQKLESMFRSSTYNNVKKISTWPLDLLYQNGQLVGYVMRNVKNNERLCDINDPSYKKLTLKDKIKIAINLCEAVEMVHNNGLVIGDMNPRNILIHPKNLKVTLIDTDSFHVPEPYSNRIHRCNVQTPEYLAPELMKRMLHGQRIDELELPTFTKETDNFALAVHIFSLLMDGCHPFTCRLVETAPESTPCPQKKENIATGFSPYFSSKEYLDIPKFSPSTKRLNGTLYNLFHVAFVNGYHYPMQRPTAKTWKEALQQAFRRQKSAVTWVAEKVVIVFLALLVATKLFPDTLQIPFFDTIWDTIEDVTDDWNLDNWSIEDIELPEFDIQQWTDDIKDTWDDFTNGILDWSRNLKFLSQSDSNRSNSNASTESSTQESNLLSNFYVEGIIYPDSNSRYLTMEEVALLNNYSTEYTYAKLLRHIVNEIYARHGYIFQNQTWSAFYEQYAWYNQLEKRTNEQISLNEYEFANVELILQIERENGFY